MDSWPIPWGFDGPSTWQACYRQWRPCGSWLACRRAAPGRRRIQVLPSLRLQRGERGNGTSALSAGFLPTPPFSILSLFTLLVFFTRTGSRQTLLPLLAVEKMGMSATQLGFLFTCMTTINLCLVLPAGALTDRLGRKVVILPGALLSLAGLSLFAWAGNLPTFFGAAVLMGLGTGLIGPAPAAYAGDLAPPGKTSVTMGLYRTFGDVGFITGPILLGWIADTFGEGIANITGKGVAMEFNAFLLVGVALLLVLVGRETVGGRRRPIPS